MNLNLDNKAAIVTGASAGIGKAIALSLAKEASNVAKSGLLSLSKTLSRELATDNILVNCVSPGLIESPQNDRYFSESERKAAMGTIPLGRFGRPEEFADFVTFLCSDRASYITGINLLIDGGASRGF